MLYLKLKVLLVSVAVIFAALGLKESLPLVTTHLPLLWSFVLLCFKPPYLYFTVNAIIISILASSRFHRPAAEPNHPLEVEVEVEVDPTPPPVVEVKAILVNRSAAVVEDEEEETKEIDIGMPLKRINSTEIAPEYPSPIDKPLVSARFSHRKPLKFSPEGGRSLRVARAPKRHETLENTWKAITEGRSMPLSRHMKKCDTWQNRTDTGPPEPEDEDEEEATTTSSSVSVCETFNFNKAGRLRKEPSLSQDELNRRVEAFIHKFNQQMRLQRQESLNHYMHT